MYTFTTKIGTKIISWIFYYERDYKLYTQQILPNTGIAFRVLSNDPVPAGIPDFIVSVYQDFDESTLPPFRQLMFKIHGERGGRFRKTPRTYQFVNSPRPDDDLTWTRYSWAFSHRSGPRSAEVANVDDVSTGGKKRVLCVVDSGRRPDRVAKILKIADTVGGDIEIFGDLGVQQSGERAELSGHHNGAENEKYEGIVDSAFYLSIEHTRADDYVTEKVMDAILCEAVPIYIGAPNAGHYLLPGSYLEEEDLDGVDWTTWRDEYAKRRPAVLLQKQIILKKLNVFSFFDRITDNPRLLDEIRVPILDDGMARRSTVQSALRPSDGRIEIDTTELSRVASVYRDDPGIHRAIYDAFTRSVEDDAGLLRHRLHVEKEDLGFGDRAFHWLWKLVVDAAPQHFRFLEVGVYKGQVISLVGMLASRVGKQARVYGVSPMDSTGDRFSRYPVADYPAIIDRLQEWSGIAPQRRAHIIRGLSTDDSTKRVCQSFGPYDVVYVDGGHEYDTVVNDIVTYGDIVAPGGLFIMDDAAVRLRLPAGIWPGHADVSRAVADVLDQDKCFRELMSVGHVRVWRKQSVLESRRRQADVDRP